MRGILAFMAKTVFIGHPIGGDIRDLEAIFVTMWRKCLRFARRCTQKETIPVAPYLISLQYLNDEVSEDRELGMEANHECFRRRYIDELWLFGDKISSGMWKEILLARKIGIPIIAKTAETKRDLESRP